MSRNIHVATAMLPQKPHWKTTAVDLNIQPRGYPRKPEFILEREQQPHDLLLQHLTKLKPKRLHLTPPS